VEAMVVAHLEEEALVAEVAGEDVNKRNDNNNSPYKIVFRKIISKSPSNNLRYVYCLSNTPSEALISLTATYFPFLF
jgi:hypothetical protein